MRRPARICLALLALAAAARADAPSEDARPLPNDGVFEVAEALAPGVWSIRQAQPFHVQPVGNVTVIEQAAGLVLVDSGGSPGSGRRIADLVAGLSPKPVTAIALTHWHGDHVLGVPALLARWPSARVIATAATRAHLGERRTMNAPASADAAANARIVAGFREIVPYALDQSAHAPSARQRAGWEATARLFSQVAADMDGALTLQPGEDFADVLRLADAERPVELRFLGRGNTDGDAIAWLPRQRIAVAGDLVVAPIPYGFESYPAEWIATLEALRALPFDLLVPGHGAPQRGRAALDARIGLLRDVRAQVNALAARGHSRDETLARVDLASQAARFCGDDPWLRQWFAEYWTAPIVRSAFKEATGAPIVQDLHGD